MNHETKTMSIMTLGKLHDHEARLSADEAPTDYLLQRSFQLLINTIPATRVIETETKFVSPKSTTGASLQGII